MNNHACKTPWVDHYKLVCSNGLFVVDELNPPQLSFVLTQIKCVGTLQDYFQIHCGGISVMHVRLGVEA